MYLCGALNYSVELKLLSKKMVRLYKRCMMQSMAPSPFVNFFVLWNVQQIWFVLGVRHNQRSLIRDRYNEIVEVAAISYCRKSIAR